MWVPGPPAGVAGGVLRARQRVLGFIVYWAFSCRFIRQINVFLMELMNLTDLQNLSPAVGGGPSAFSLSIGLFLVGLPA
jgi:hypothetical protein